MPSCFRRYAKLRWSEFLKLRPSIPYSHKIIYDHQESKLLFLVFWDLVLLCTSFFYEILHLQSSRFGLFKVVHIYIYISSCIHILNWHIPKQMLTNQRRQVLNPFWLIIFLIYSVLNRCMNVCDLRCGRSVFLFWVSVFDLIYKQTDSNRIAIEWTRERILSPYSPKSINYIPKPIIYHWSTAGFR